VTQQVTRHAGLEAGGDGVDGARLGPERADDLRHSREEVLFVFFFFCPPHTHTYDQNSKVSNETNDPWWMRRDQGTGGVR
jgi:hypothetical protein